MLREEVIEPAETISALRLFNVVTILQTSVIAILFIGPPRNFLRPVTPPDPGWLSLMFAPGFEVWDIVFVIATGLLIFSTIKLRWMIVSHLFTAAFWGALGLLWSVGALFAGAQDYLLGAGIFAIFIASQHIAIAGVWKAEGVN